MIPHAHTGVVYIRVVLEKAVTISWILGIKNNSPYQTTHSDFIFGTSLYWYTKPHILISFFEQAYIGTLK